MLRPATVYTVAGFFPFLVDSLARSLCLVYSEALRKREPVFWTGRFLRKVVATQTRGDHLLFKTAPSSVSALSKKIDKDKNNDKNN